MNLKITNNTLNKYHVLVNGDEKILGRYQCVNINVYPDDCIRFIPVKTTKTRIPHEFTLDFLFTDSVITVFAFEIRVTVGNILPDAHLQLNQLFFDFKSNMIYNTSEIEYSNIEILNLSYIPQKSKKSEMKYKLYCLIADGNYFIYAGLGISIYNVVKAFDNPESKYIIMAAFGFLCFAFCLIKCILTMKKYDKSISYSNIQKYVVNSNLRTDSTIN